MHILHVAPYYAPAYSFGGVVTMLEGLAQAQIQQGHTVTVLTTDALTLEARYQGAMQTVQAGVQVVRVRNRWYALRRYNLSTPLDLTQHAERLMPLVDVVHLHEFRTVENVQVVPVAVTHDVPIALSPHGTLTYDTGRSALKRLWDRVLSARIVPHIQRVLALAPPEAEDTRRTWAQFKHTPIIRIIPNGVNPAPYRTLPDASAFRARYQLADDVPVILFMGRLHARKGVDVLARAFLRANLGDARLLIVGPDEGMRAQLERLYDERIILTGYLDGEARLSALGVADLFVLPAIGEGLSMAVLEAMASGVPVLLSPECNLPQVVTAQAGEIVPVNADALADALRRLLGDRDALAQMGHHAQDLIQKQFTWSTIARQIEAVYKNLTTL
ncbi:MAG: glycosyltransferase [Anaerolineae bacterium]